MPVLCPHCTKEVPNVVDQATLEQRLREQKGSMVEKAAYDMVKAQLDNTGRELAGARADLELRDTMGARGITDPKVMKSIAAIYGAETSGVEADKRPALSAWLDGDGKTHPVIGLLVKPTTTPPGTPGAAPAPGTTTTPPAPNAPGAAPPNPTGTVNPGGAGGPPPAAPQAKLTEADIAKIFASPEYLALTPADRSKRRAELYAQVKQQQEAGPTV